MEKHIDFYSVQCYVDGFGHDTYVLATFKTEMEAQKYADEYSAKYNDEDVVIVPQTWGEFEQYWD